MENKKMATASFFDLNPIYGNKTLYLGVPRWYYQDLKDHFEITVDESLQSWESVDMTQGQWVNGKWAETWSSSPDNRNRNSNNINIVFVRSATNNIDIHAAQSSFETHQRDYGTKKSYYMYHSEMGDTQYLMFRFHSPGEEAWFKLLDEDSGYIVTQHPMVFPCSLHGCWLKSDWSLNLERVEL